MLWNIIDRRERSYRWKRVNAIIEATSNDNSVKDSDRVDVHDDDVVYDQRANVTVAEAVEWAMSQDQPVTLFLYDAGKGF
ncbi:MAG: hypothetical protein J7521_08160 [Caulobacter sp.]|nr:hypothetical protein [Caulobacter sp.]